jgi:hypothetical protein
MAAAATPSEAFWTIRRREDEKSSVMAGSVQNGGLKQGVPTEAAPRRVDDP